MSAGAGFQFKSSTDTGAFLRLEAPALTVRNDAKLRIVQYMRDHFSQWLSFANDECGIGLEEHQLIFVCGTTKTTRCVTVSFREYSRNVEGTVTGSAGSLALAQFSVMVSNHLLPMDHQRESPARAPRPENLAVPSGSGPASDAEPQNKCIFMNYFKMKRRYGVWPFKGPMRAAAGNDRLPSPPPGPGGSPTSPTTSTGRRYSYDSGEYDFERGDLYNEDSVRPSLRHMLYYALMTS